MRRRTFDHGTAVNLRAEFGRHGLRRALISGGFRLAMFVALLILGSRFLTM